MSLSDDESFSSYSDGFSDTNDPAEADQWYDHVKHENHALTNWIKARHELRNTPNHLLQNATNTIIHHIFGGINNLLLFLIDASHDDTVQNIHQIIKHINLEYKRSKISKTTILQSVDEDEGNMEEKQNNYFDITPNESISYILGFLNKNEIEEFKVLSTRMSIIGLQEMMKFTVNISNMNELIHYDFNNKLINNDNIKWNQHRFNPNRTVQSLQEQYNKMYDIKEENQFLIPISESDEFEGFYINKKRMKQINKEIMPNIRICNLDRNIIIFDKANIIKMNEENEINIMSSRDKLDTDHGLVILKYFDILNQSTDIIQYIFIHKNINYRQIMEYIQNNFVPITKKQKIFHKTLTNNIKKMQFDNSDQDILSMYHTISPEYKWQHGNPNQNISPFFKYNKCITLVFELNYKHNWVQNKLKDMTDPKLFIRFQNYLHYARCIRIISKYDISTLKRQIELFPDCTASANIDEFDWKKGKEYEIQNKSITYGELKKMIANDLGNNINCNNLEIKTYDNTEIVDVKNNECLDFEMVSYDTSQRDYGDVKRVYDINIYLPDNAPLPFYDKSNATTITIQFGIRIVAQQMIDYIFQNVLKASFDCKQFQNISSLYVKEKNNMQYILKLHGSTYFKPNNVYILCSEFDRKINREQGIWKKSLDLFMMFKPENNEKKAIKITIFFLRKMLNKKTVFSTLLEHYFCGLPLEIYVDKDQSITDIINENDKLNKYKEYVNGKYAFKVDKTDNKILLISTEYKVENNDVIILKIIKTPCGLESNCFIKNKSHL